MNNCRVCGVPISLACYLSGSIKTCSPECAHKATQLKELAKAKNCTIASLIRQAVDLMLERDGTNPECRICGKPIPEQRFIPGRLPSVTCSAVCADINRRRNMVLVSKRRRQRAAAERIKQRQKEET